MIVPHKDLVKAAVAKQLYEARQWLKICTYSCELTSLDIYQIISLIELDVKIDLISSKQLAPKVLDKLNKLYNIRIFNNPLNHAKVYINESSCLVTSCNYGNVRAQKLIECGVRILRSDLPVAYNQLKKQVDEIIKDSKLVMPLLPFRPEKPYDLRDFIFR